MAAGHVHIQGRVLLLQCGYLGPQILDGLFQLLNDSCLSFRLHVKNFPLNSI